MTEPGIKPATCSRVLYATDGAMELGATSVRFKENTVDCGTRARVKCMENRELGISIDHFDRQIKTKIAQNEKDACLFEELTSNDLFTTPGSFHCVIDKGMKNDVTNPF